MWRHSSVIFQLNTRTHSHQQHYLWVRKTTAKLLVNINKKANFGLKMFCFMYSFHELHYAQLYRVHKCQIPTNNFCRRDSQCWAWSTFIKFFVYLPSFWPSKKPTKEKISFGYEINALPKLWNYYLYKWNPVLICLGLGDSKKNEPKSYVVLWNA